MDLLNVLDGYKPYGQLKNLLTKKCTVSVSGVCESANPHLISALSKEGALVLVYNENEAASLVREISFYTDKVCHFMDKEYVFFNIDAKNRQRELSRIKALYNLKKGYIVVASLESLMTYTIAESDFEKLSFEIKTGEEYDIDKITEKLIKMGYRREDLTEGVGQFSLRGGILDVFSPSMDKPVRNEFFGDEVDSVRLFDPSTQRSVENIDVAEIIPVSELSFDFDREKLIKLLEKTARLKTTKEELKKTVLYDAEILSNGENLTSIDKYIGCIFDEIPSIISYLKEDTKVFLIEPKRLNERAKVFEWEIGEKMAEYMGKICPKNIPLPWISYKTLSTAFSSCRMVSLNSLSHTSLDYKYTEILDFFTKTSVSLHGKIEYLFDDIKNWQKTDTTVVILAGNKNKAQNFNGLLNENGIKSVLSQENHDIQKGAVNVLVGHGKKGFEYPEIGFALVSEEDILGADKKQRERKIEKEKRIRSYTDINPGDFVVHRAHGIGEYAGIKKIEVSGITKDYFMIKYQGTDVLYVPVDQMDMLYKYIGSGEKNVKLNKLGGSEWNKAKQKVKSATKDMAKKLVSLYAERENTKGFSFSEDSPWQREFEDDFHFTETPDQLRSIEEVKADMEKSKPMDRLLLGDVGYGKTEVALRASFKACQDSKQVIYLCPTTVLAMQHYETYKTRMANFPIKVEMLSRFRTEKEQKEIIKKLKTGEIDVIIGTHRLLQKDIIFKDPGLLIIDEEQRFGVSDKEKIKELKKNIDVLSMSATPIPRTLHMAMLSVRDMSLLETPPENRYPVETFVMEHNMDVLKDAMEKELSRGGQVFYIYNRISGIFTVAEKIRKLLPDARIGVGHGRMREEELENIMYQMINGELDILVCTTIIETGLDIPNANTIIVENADRMGLSQLYQLRGRVGRSKRSAYAYMTYKKDKSLSETAAKRLSAIREFIEFGSGFKIAMRDLEIRGAGNILGAEQHGHMDSVGYDMYLRLLSESVKEIEGVSKAEDIDVLIDISVDAYIPEKYIKNQNQRIDSYKQIAAISSGEDARDAVDELIDRFGEPPKAVLNLVEIAEIKALSKEAGVLEISEKPTGRFIITLEESPYVSDNVMKLILSNPKDVKPINGAKPKISYTSKDIKNKLSNVKFILQTIISLKNEEK